MSEFAIYERPRRIGHGQRLGLAITIGIQCPGCDLVITDTFRGLKLGQSDELWLTCEACSEEINATVTVRAE